MDYGLLIRALEKHVKISQAAVTFAREHKRGRLFAESMYVLDEAQRALQHIKDEQHAKGVGSRSADARS
jgi:hypothetical protein